MDRTLQLTRALDLAAEKARGLKLREITDDVLLHAIYVEIQYDVLGRMMYSHNFSSYEFKNFIRNYYKSIINTGLEEENMPLSKRTVGTMEKAKDYAIKSNCDIVDISHVLLALFDSNDTVVVGFLMKNQIDTTVIKKEIMQYIFTGAVDSMIVRSSNSNNEETTARTKEIPSVILENCEDLTLAALKGEIDPIIGRDKETDMIIETLARRTKNNVLLVGEAGSGKTAMIKGLALKVANGEIPALANKKIFNLKMGSLMSGTEYRGKLEGKVQKLMDAFMEMDNSILFIDEAHTLIGSGSSSDNKTDIAQLLKPAMTGRKLQLICATTLKEMKQIESDGAFMRRLNTIKIEEPSDEDTLAILKGLAYKYEEFHNVDIPEETLEAAVKLSSRYITERHQPDKAIDILDNAAAKLKLSKITVNDLSSQTIMNKIEALESELKDLFDIEAVGKLYGEIKELKEDYKKAVKEEKEKQVVRDTLMPNHIANVVEARTGIPVSKLTKSDREKLLTLEDDMHKAIIGQDEAIKAIATALRRSGAGVCDPNRPIASFLFAGSTGTGKSEVAKVLADLRFGSRDNIIRIDCAEYSESHSISKLIGAPKGYVGYGSGGMLTEAIRTKNHAVILFDEVEKGSKELFDLLLGLLDEGRITDSEGLTVNAKNCIIIMTTNMGSAISDNTRSVGFGFGDNKSKEEQEHENLKEKTLESIKKQVRPEIINRIDDIIVFHKLNKEEQREICRLMGNKVDLRLADQGMTIRATDEAIDFIVEDGYDQSMGARPMMRAIMTHIEQPLSLFILEEKVTKGDHIAVELKDDELVFYRIRDGVKTELN